MASQMLSAFCFLLFSLCCFHKSFASRITQEHQLQLQQTHHLLQLNSLFPSSICSSPPKDSRKRASLQVFHKHGPCSKLKHDKANAPTHMQILTQDESRVDSIQAKLSKKDNLKQLDSTSLPAKPGSLLGTGNYFVTLGLGTPKEDLSLIFDTGSDLTWTQCQPCARSCYSQKDPIFDPSRSTSYSNVTCTSTTCTQLTTATGNQPACAASSKACIYGIQYGDSSYSVGYFSQERLTVSSTDVFDGFLFGCGQNNQGLFGGTAGLLGLGRHPVSFVQQTAQKYHKIFSYCLPATSSSVGHLTFGGGDSNDVKYTPISTISRGSSFYGIDIIGITVGANKLPISASIFSAGGSIIDSGTVITRLPPTAYSSLRDAFRQAMSKYPSAGEVSILDTCYDLSGYKTFYVPKISFSLKGGVDVELSAEGILYVISEKQTCLAFAANGDDADVTIFGNVQQRKLEVVYDVGAAQIGFGAGGCK